MTLRRIARHGAGGYSLLEGLLVLALLASASAIGAPLAASMVEDERARQAAGFIASRFRLARERAAATGAAEAVVFDPAAGAWTFRVCADGNGNGVRRGELAGPDRCTEDSRELGALFPRVRIARDVSIPDPAGGPASPDPVRFGASDVATFTPYGTATAGTVYLLSAAGVQYAVRVAGVTGRTRVLRYDSRGSQWEVW